MADTDIRVSLEAEELESLLTKLQADRLSLEAQAADPSNDKRTQQRIKQEREKTETEIQVAAAKKAVLEANTVKEKLAAEQQLKEAEAQKKKEEDTKKIVANIQSTIENALSKLNSGMTEYAKTYSSYVDRISTRLVGSNDTYSSITNKLNNVFGASPIFQMKTVMENCKVNKRVRLILGLNEENNWKCINYYKEHEEIPTIGFSPDADFPCIYAEKSILTSYFQMDYTNFLNEPIIINNVDCNHNALNVVPKICSCILEIDINKILMSDFISNIKKIKNKYDYEIDIYKIDDKHVKLTSYGIQAHSAHPDLQNLSIFNIMEKI